MLFDGIKLAGIEVVERALLPPRLDETLIQLSQRASPITPLHGRSASVQFSDQEWLSIKGIGWTRFRPSILKSRKDARLAFGLYGVEEAKRESAVSRRLTECEIRCARVVAWAPIESINAQGTWRDIRDLQWSDGTPVQPAVLVTRACVPARVADLGWFSVEERMYWAQKAVPSLGSPADDFVTAFATRLGTTVAQLHRLGGVNDTLEVSNVTLAAELTDFEWLYVPGVPLPDGTTEIGLPERQWKEVLYGAEVVQQLAWQSGSRERDSIAISGYLGAYLEAGGPHVQAVRDLEGDFSWD